MMCVVGDLKLNGKYGESVMLVCADRLIAVDEKGKLVPTNLKTKPFNLKDNSTVKYCGIINRNGSEDTFEVIMKLNTLRKK